MIFNPLDYTTVFLSYDEPNAEENFRHLLTLNPNALRVHGVKGSDTAHKEVAKLSKSDSVIIVDADNVVKPNFYSTTIELPKTVDMNTSVLSFSAYNTINGNSYGNGGIKVWPISVLGKMKTHEASDNRKNTVDFDCSSYVELNTSASEVHIHHSPLQAFRAGFREGVKLSLDNDVPVSWEQMDKYNFDRLWMWMHVGSDVDNGLYAIYGARLGAYLTLSENTDYTQIRDFDYLNNLFNTIDMNDIDVLGRKLKHPMIVDVLGTDDSRHIRSHYINPKRSNYPQADTTRFMAWSEGFRECAKATDLNKINMLCSLGRDKPFGIDRINGAIHARGYNDSPVNLYDYNWLNEQYDRLHTNSL